MVLATPGTGAITAPCSAAGPTAAGHTLCLPGMCWASWALVALVPVALAMDLSRCWSSGWSPSSARPGGRLAAHHGPAGCKQEGRNCGAGCFRNGSSCRRRRHHAEKNLRRNSGRLAPGGRAVIAATSRSNRPGRLGAGSQPAAERGGRSPPPTFVVGERPDAHGLVVARTGQPTSRDLGGGADRDPSPIAGRLSGRGGGAARGRS